MGGVGINEPRECWEGIIRRMRSLTEVIKEPDGSRVRAGGLYGGGLYLCVT